MLAAWQGLGGFAGRASVRTWLYQIATRRCLNVSRAHRRSPKAWDVPSVERPDATRLGEVVWLEPFPDALLAGATDGPLGPEARYAQTEAISDSLESTVDSVNGALKRARANLEVRRPPHSIRQSPPPSGSLAEEALVARFVRAYEAADMDALVALFTDDVFMSMPPMPLRIRGRGPVADFCASIFRAGRRFDLTPTRANGQPAFGSYLRAPSGVSRAVGFVTIALRGERIVAMSRFETSVFPGFGLSETLAARG
jgi:hypothetical protein